MRVSDVRVIGVLVIPLSPRSLHWSPSLLASSVSATRTVMVGTPDCFVFPTGRETMLQWLSLSL